MNLHPLFKRITWIDLKLFCITLLLNITGLIILYSITSGTNGDARFWKQFVFLGVGILLMLVVSAIDYQRLKGYVPWMYIITLISLLLVLLIGNSIRGTKGWFTLFGFGIQPVEFAKLVLCIVLAKWISILQTKPLSWSHLGTVAIIMGIPIGLVLLQPDAGSALILCILTMSMLLAKGISKQQAVLAFVALVLMSVVSWVSLLKPYQKERIEIFLGVKQDPYGVAYNVDQSLIAIGSGGLFGTGIGSGSQSQFRYLPEAPTDFIFASVTEELGFIGAIIVLSCFALLLKRIFTIASETRDEFSAYVTFGIGVIFLSHMTINLGAVLGLIPVTGVPLPFMSYGGSFLITSWILVGIIMSINRRNHIVH